MSDLGRGCRIIVIDSEQTVRTVIKAILEKAGYSVCATGDFQTARQMIREAKPDLVMTNVFLRGITGHDAMQVLQDDFPGIPVLMVSGLPDDSIIQSWRGDALFDTFPKPFSQRALVEKVAEMLEKSGSPQ